MSDRLFILLSAGPSRRMHPCKESRYLLPVNNEPLISRQIRIIEDLYPNADIQIGLGEDYQDIKGILPRRVKHTYCADYMKNNTCSTLQQCLLKTKRHEFTTIINGDILFNHSAIENLNSNQIVVPTTFSKKEDIGVNIVDGKATYLQFGLKNKWGQIFNFQDEHHRLIMNLLSNGDKSKWFLHELINVIIDECFSVGIKTGKNILAYDIDTCRDYKYIKKELMDNEQLL